MSVCRKVKLATYVHPFLVELGYSAPGGSLRFRSRGYECVVAALTTGAPLYLAHPQCGRLLVGPKALARLRARYEAGQLSAVECQDYVSPARLARVSRLAALASPAPACHHSRRPDGLPVDPREAFVRRLGAEGRALHKRALASRAHLGAGLRAEGDALLARRDRAAAWLVFGERPAPSAERLPLP